MENFSEFDFNESQADFSPFIPTQQPDRDEPIEQNEMQRFWAIVGNWSEFSLYFGLGLSATLAIRLLPVLLSAGIIMAIAVAVAIALLLLQSTHPKEKLTYQLLLLALVTALIGGYWDAIVALLAVALDWIDTNKYWVLGGLLTVIILQVIRRGK